ncbi:MAG: glycosyltransferase [Ilumatobacter sp.]
MIATPGGHVDEMYDLATRLFDADRDRIWITARTAQTESLLRDERVEFVPAVAARQGFKALKSLPTALKLMRSLDPSLVVSTGAALAVPYLYAARALRLPTRYIESATRMKSPSITGRLVSVLPGVSLNHQARDWQLDKWNAMGSVFDIYTHAPTTAEHPDLVDMNIVVSFGTEKFPFERGRDRIQAALDGVDDVLWQLGTTPSRADLSGRQAELVPYDELMDAIVAADVVVTHAGVGSILSVLRAGKCPVVLPREERHGEHVDDHQVELSKILVQRGLAVMVGPDDDVAQAIDRALDVKISQRAIDDAFHLD